MNPWGLQGSNVWQGHVCSLGLGSEGRFSSRISEFTRETCKGHFKPLNVTGFLGGQLMPCETFFEEGREQQ